MAIGCSLQFHRHRHDVSDRADSRLRPDFQPDRPALRLLQAIRAGTAFRLQQDERAPVLCRYAEKYPDRRSHRPAFVVGGAAANGKIRQLVVVVRLAGLERFSVADVGAVPDRDRAAIQQIYATHRRESGTAHRRLDAAGWLCGKRTVCDGWFQAQRSRQCLFFGLRRRQADCLFRHLAVTPGA